MSSDPKDLAKLYAEYIRASLESMDKEDVINQFINTVLASMDFNDPAVKGQVVKVLLKYELKKKERGIVEEAQPQQGDAEDAPESDSGEELDFSSMYKPSTFDELLDHLTLLRTSHADIVEIEDMLNLVSVIKSLKPYMFDAEVPWIGLIDETLCIVWAKDIKSNVIIAFLDGMMQLELTHKEEYSELLLDDEGLLEEHHITEVLQEVQDVT